MGGLNWCTLLVPESRDASILSVERIASTKLSLEYLVGHCHTTTIPNLFTELQSQMDDMSKKLQETEQARDQEEMKIKHTELEAKLEHLLR